MIYENQEYKHPASNNILNLLMGLLIGGLTGAVTMLLLAPQSGKDSRIQLQKKGIELRNRATEMVEDTVAKVRMDGNKIAMGGRQKTKELLEQGQTLVVEQLDRVSEVALAGKKAIQSS